MRKTNLDATSVSITNKWGETMTKQKIEADIEAIMCQWSEAAYIRKDGIFVVGCSTSEVLGEQIGTFGSDDVAKILYEQFDGFAAKHQIQLAFQCCEHLNRALVVERKVAKQYEDAIVSVIPQKDAGGSMATYAFQHMEDPVIIEYIRADAGMDIGDTFIGMHLKPVAVPVRFDRDEIGAAHATFVRTRPKLIGGARAVYKAES